MHTLVFVGTSIVEAQRIVRRYIFRFQFYFFHKHSVFLVARGQLCSFCRKVTSFFRNTQPMAPSFNTIFDESDVCFQFGACGRYMYNKNR